MKKNIFKGFHKNEKGKELAFIDGKWEVGSWIEGNLILLDDADEDYSAIIIPRIGSECITNGTEEYIKFENWYKVVHSTVSQSTGVTDINDRIIFENDIIKYRDKIKTMGLTTHCSKVEWNDTIGGFVCRAVGVGYCNINTEQSKLFEMEVIGNSFNITKGLEPMCPKGNETFGFSCPHCSKKIINNTPHNMASKILPCENCGGAIYWQPTWKVD